MLYFYHGTDTERAHEQAKKLVSDLSEKKLEAAVFRIDSEGFDAAQIEEYIESQGLFENKYIVFLDRVGEKKDHITHVANRADALAKSQNIFILFEENVDVALKRKLLKYADKTKESKKTKSSDKKGTFNIFSLTDAFGSRDRKRLWVLYQEAVRAGSQPEEIHGILFWQVKSMLLAQSTDSAVGAGLKPFVYTKAKGFLKNYSDNEIQDLSSNLVGIYHSARRGVVEFDVGLEKFILGT